MGALPASLPVFVQWTARSKLPSVAAWRPNVANPIRPPGRPDDPVERQARPGTKPFGTGCGLSMIIQEAHEGCHPLDDLESHQSSVGARERAAQK
jgi:hypothetical protein